ncbi:MAG: phage holin family protein [Synechococcaceae cyanobacterium]|nr:phage holin family protein [Synechococcaceae cyanobacterium]
MGGLLWLLQWPIRALILLLVAWLPLGVEMESFPVALLSAIVIGLLGTLLGWLLGAALFLPRAVVTLGGLIPIGWLFDWLITIILFALAAWLIRGFRLRNGFLSAALGAFVYSVLSYLILNAIPGLEVKLTGIAAFLSAPLG